MKKYGLKQEYSSIFDDIDMGDVVYCEDDLVYFFNKKGNKTNIEIDVWESFYKDFWELIDEKEPLFIAKDGAVFFDDVYYLVTKPYFVKTRLKAKESIYKGDGFIYFKHESNADEYILWNKPLLNLKYIEERKQQLRELEEFWQDFKNQNEHLSFDSNAFQHIQAKVSSKMAFLQKSINDHKKFV